MWRAWVAVGMAGVALAGCGGGDDDTSTTAGAPPATVDGQPIPPEQLARWTAGMRALALSGGAAEAAAEQEAEVRALSALIRVRWVEGEAEQRGLDVSDEDLAAHLRSMRSTPEAAKAVDALADAGLTDDDLASWARVDMLEARMQHEAVDPVTPADVRDEYRRTKRMLGTPERRDLHAVVAATREDGRSARQALDGGASWRSIVRRYAMDETSVADGLYEDVTIADQDPLAVEAVFGSAAGERGGPVRVTGGFLVYEVMKVHPGKPPTLDAAAPEIKAGLEQQRADEAITNWSTAVLDEWRPKTVCAPSLLVEQCSNAPEPPTP